MKWNRDKKELWENDKTKFQIWKINTKLKIAKFNRQTHGMGMMIIVMMFFLVAFMIVQLIVNAPQHIDTAEAQQSIKIAQCMIHGGCIWGA